MSDETWGLFDFSDEYDAREDARQLADQNSELQSEIVALKARVAELEAAQGLFPHDVYMAFVAGQNTHLHREAHIYKLYALEDAMKDAILNRPTGFPITPKKDA